MLTWALIAASALAIAQPPTDSYRLTAEAFGQPVSLEVHGPTRSEAHTALSTALEEMRSIERLVDPQGDEPGGLGSLNRASGTGAVPVDPRLASLLQRALYFCEWSEGAYGPLGGHLNEIWHGASSRELSPAATLAVAPAIAAARCERLSLADDLTTATLAAGSRTDLFGFGAGFAIDRAVGVLQQYGITNGLVTLGSNARAFGPGASGRGWPLSLSEMATLGNSENRLWLLDRSLAVAAQDDDGYRPSAGEVAPYVHHRRGEPTGGVLAVLVSTEMAADSQGLASCLFVSGSRQGQLQLGVLRPAPAVRWMMGSGVGAPLVIDYHWTEVSRGTP